MEKIPSQRKYLFWITLIVADFVTINASYAIAVQLLHRMNVGLAVNIYQHHWIFYNFFWLSSVGFWRLYQFEMLQNMERMYRAKIRTTSSFVFVFIINLYTTNDNEFTSEFVWI